MKYYEIHESHEKVGGSPVPQGRSRIAHRFNGGSGGTSGASPVRDERNAVPNRKPSQSLLPSLPGLDAARTSPPSDESLGYGRSSLRDLPRLLSCLSCLSWFLLAFSAFAQPVTVLDRIGTNSVSTDNNPGGFATHYAHSTANEFWGTCGTVWTQPFNGTLAEAAFVGFARVVNATNGMLLDPVTNLSAFAMSVHLWTNGVAGFLAGTNSGHGDVVIPLGAGPAAPQIWGVTVFTNSVVNSTNRYISVLPTFRVATNLSALNLRLQAGREYAVALVFEGVSGNMVVRQSFATTTGAPDLLATYAGPGSLKTGPATNAFNRTQFATSITALPEAPVTLAIAQRTAGLELNLAANGLAAGTVDDDEPARRALVALARPVGHELPDYHERHRAAVLPVADAVMELDAGQGRQAFSSCPGARLFVPISRSTSINYQAVLLPRAAVGDP